MIDKQDRIGEVHGIYKVISLSQEKDKDGYALYEVECIKCGTKKLMRYSLFTGKKQVNNCTHKTEFEIRYCLECGNPIPINGQKRSKYNVRKFCSRSCCASYTNKRKQKKLRPKKYCPVCKKEIPYDNKFCSVKCAQKHHRDEYIERWKNGLENGIRGKKWIDVSEHIKTYLFEKYNSKCARCGWGEVNPFTNKIPLEIEHIDGNALNNKEENLILICPNCHSLTATYRGANKGKGARNIKWISRAGCTNTT